jgi:hypothetical protein
VATTQLSSAPVIRARAADSKEDSLLDLDKAIGIQDQTMSVQAARGCLMLNAKELIASLLSSLNSPLESNHPTAKNNDNVGSPVKSTPGNGTSAKNTPDKRNGVAQMLSGGVWGGLDGGGVGSNLQQFVLIGACEILWSHEKGRDEMRWDGMEGMRSDRMR